MSDLTKYGGVIPAFYACYDDGGALLTLGLACLDNGDPESATNYLKRVNELFPDGEYGEEARTKLDEIAAAASQNTEE